MKLPKPLDSSVSPPVVEAPLALPVTPPSPPTLRLDRSYLTVRTTPAIAQVRIMNISPPYQHGIELVPGDFEIQVVASDYQPYRAWHTLVAGVIDLPIVLQKIEVPVPVPVPVSPPPPDPAEAQLQLRLAVIKKLLKSGNVPAARQALEDAKRLDRQGQIDECRRKQTAIMQTTVAFFLDQGKKVLAAQVMKEMGEWDSQSPEYQALQARLTGQK